MYIEVKLEELACSEALFDLGGPRRSVKLHQLGLVNSVVRRFHATEVTPRDKGTGATITARTVQVCEAALLGWHKEDDDT